MTLSEELRWRGFVNQTTLKDITVLDNKKLTFYWGVDPSSSSMTVGNLAMAMMVRHFIAHGHKAVLLVGGATGMIGDPDGKDEERELKSLDELKNNKAAISAQYQQIFADQPFELVDNYEWFKDVGYLQFLRDVGKHFSMTQLLQRDFVQTRIGRGGKGISYAEFSYTLIQGYDFLHLFRTKGVTLQVCGADQWGNSLSGVELIRKLDGKEAHVWSGPLVVNHATGKKFGKSEAGAIWLDAQKTRVFDFYQFWLNVGDESACEYIKIYTLLPKDKIIDIIARFKKDPAGRLAQKTLAYEVTKIVHGQQAATEAKEASEELFTGAVSDLTPAIVLEEGEYDTVDILVKAGLAATKSEARRALAQGGVRLNQQKVDTPTIRVRHNDLLQIGKRRFVKIAA